MVPQVSGLSVRARGSMDETSLFVSSDALDDGDASGCCCIPMYTLPVYEEAPWVIDAQLELL